MNVLLVDGEPLNLETLQRALATVGDPRWRVVVARSAEEAMQVTTDEAVDLVITGVELVDSAGRSLLARLLDAHPAVVRIALAGPGDEGAAVATVSLAHQLLVKPCSATELCDVIARAETMRRVLSSEALRAAVGSVDSLPPLPSTYRDLERLLSDEGVPLERVAAIVARDAAVSALVLRVVSSAFFVRARRVTDVGQAIGLIGLRLLRSIALASAFHGRTRAEADAASRSLERGALLGGVARFLAEPQHRETAFSAGLLADLGQAVLARTMAQQSAAAARRAQVERKPLSEMERVVLGTTHAEVGGYLLGLWALPPAVVDAVARHHTPPQKPPMGAVSAADAVATAAWVLERGSAPPWVHGGSPLGTRLMNAMAQLQATT